MHYDLNKIIVKTEYSAKSVKQPNQIVLNYINTLPREATVLDYGCGKYRYTIPISKKVKTVVAVDSRYQIERLQRINDKTMSLKTYTEKYLKNVILIESENERWRSKYDYIFCTNVLSAIPERPTRIDVLRNLKKSLTQNGRMFLCVQYRNTYFERYNDLHGVVHCNNGWIIPLGKDYTYYGIIPPEELEKLCTETEMEVISRKIKDGSCFFEAKHREQ
ncbi:MAG: class I SAM-dependent methyltransferase [Clostridia bacterium]